jgi:hypothetical protein
MPLTNRFGRSASTALLAFALFASACIVREERLPETGATLEGTIKYGDEPVEYALIQVLGANGVGTGIVGEDGRYRVENAPLGEVRVGVNTAAAQGQYQSKMMASGVYKGPEAKGKGRVVGLKFIQIPEKYYNPDTSGFKTTINKGANTYDIIVPK